MYNFNREIGDRPDMGADAKNNEALAAFSDGTSEKHCCKRLIPNRSALLPTDISKKPASLFSRQHSMELAKDRDWMRIRENVRSCQMQTSDLPDCPFALNADQGIRVSEIVKKLIAQGGGYRLYYNDQIFWDMELQDAVEEACTMAIVPDGWDTPITELEQIDATGRGDRIEYEITIMLYASSDE